MTDETLLTFPCQFPIKVMGKVAIEFDLLVIELIRQHIDNLDLDAVKCRPSQGGNYLAVTVTVTATSKQQLDAIYQTLSAHPLVLMAL
jgi:putative lipoic acid-binding regulatory protein